MSQGWLRSKYPWKQCRAWPLLLIESDNVCPKEKGMENIFFSPNIPAKRSTTKVVFFLPLLFSQLYSSQHHCKNTSARYNLNRTKHPFWKILSAVRLDWYQPIGQRKLNREGCVCVCVCREGEWILLCSCLQGPVEILKKMKTSVSEGFFPLSMPPFLTTATI